MVIVFEAKLDKIKSRQVIRLPLDSSERLPSRGMVMVQGTINNISFQAPLEPDGKGSHWIDISSSLSDEAGIAINDNLVLNIESTNEWLEPEIPEDIINAIVKSDNLTQWDSVTTKG
ncbi:MAG TPA: DUF1905 domain-containing protein [Epulopiscium sp.]|nr:DUF1905 domain-containing protein [Candidatus Epulonipiscium sp.]